MNQLADSDVVDEIDSIWTRLGAEGHLFVQNLSTGRSLGIRESARVPLASVAKVAIVAGLLDQAEHGGIDLARRIDIDPSTSTPGSTGISTFCDPVTMSLRDVAAIALEVSDNAAADALYALIGSQHINELLMRHGLRAFSVHSPMARLYDVIDEVAGGDEHTALRIAAEDERVHRTGLLSDPTLNAGSVRAAARLFALIHRHELISPDSDALLQTWLRRQVFRNRIPSGFPMDSVEYYGKTGTFLNLRHEAGIVVDDDGSTYAIAVFTRSSIATFSQPELDASIGYCARLAIDHLRPTA